MNKFRNCEMIFAFLLLYIAVGSKGQNICADVPGDRTQFINNPTSCSAWIACNGGKVVRIGNCDGGYNFDSSIGSCRPASTTPCATNSFSNICRGKLDGSYVSNPRNCKGYFYCKENVGFPGLCENNFIFDEKLNQCISYPNYVCPSGGGNSIDGGNHGPTLDSNTPCDYFSDGSFISDAKNCSAYYTCHSGQAVKGSCPWLQYFDPTTSRCEDQKNVQCSIAGGSRPINVTEICGTQFDVGYQGFAPDPASCKGYYYCPDGKYSTTAIQGFCPDNLFFDIYSRKCAKSPMDGGYAACYFQPCYGKPEGYFHRDAHNCSVYYYCGSLGPIAGSCPNGYNFDEAKQNCNSAASVECTTVYPTTLDMTGTTPYYPSSSSTTSSPTSTDSTSEAYTGSL